LTRIAGKPSRARVAASASAMLAASVQSQANAAAVAPSARIEAAVR